MQRPVLFKRCSTFWLAGAAGLFACLLTFALAVHGGGQVFDGFFVLLLFFCPQSSGFCCPDTVLCSFCRWLRQQSSWAFRSFFFWAAFFWG